MADGNMSPPSVPCATPGRNRIPLAAIGPQPQGGTLASMSETHLSREAYERLQAELEDLTTRGRVDIAQAIETARELGDLKENAEYHVAKDDQAHLETRIKVLRARLDEASVVEADDDSPVFSFGRTAEVRDEATGEVHTWTLVGSTESDPRQGRLSAESPVGRALRDAAVGETVVMATPKGERRFKVQALVEP